MAYSSGNGLGNKKPLYFFYDCETTGLDVEADKIVEVAAVIHLAGLKSRAQRELRNASLEFSFLCYCDKELGEVPQRLTGLTRNDLKDELLLEEVLMEFFEWMKAFLGIASRLDREEYTPVLVAHSGNSLDFLMLDKAIQNSYPLKQIVCPLNIRYLDTYPVCIELQSTRKLPAKQLNLEIIYSTLFRTSLEAHHRALPDARGLLEIFSESHLSREMGMLLKFIQNRKEMLEMKEHVKNFGKVPIGVYQASKLLVKGITYQTMCTEYRRNPHNFREYMERSGIKKPKPAQIEHFRFIQ